MKSLRRLKKILHWESSPKPEISVDKDIYAQLKPFRMPFALVQLSMLFGTLGYVFLENYTLSEAIFQAGYTLTTTGFGALREDKFKFQTIVFTITLMLLGFLIITLAIGVIIDIILKGSLQRLIKERNMLCRVARLKGHYVVCYHNEYTIQLAEQFRASHIPFVVIDPREDLEQIAEKYKYPFYIIDEPHTEQALLKSHLSSAKGIISFSKNIADNIAQIASVRLFEKELKRKPYEIICNAENLNDIEKLKKLGANSVISPTKLMAQKVSMMVIKPDIENILEEVVYRKDISLDLEEIKIPTQSWTIFKKLKETHLRETKNVSVVGIKQKDGKFIPMPKGDTIITKDSVFLVIGKPVDIKEAKKLLYKKDKPEELKYI